MDRTSTLQTATGNTSSRGSQIDQSSVDLSETPEQEKNDGDRNMWWVCLSASLVLFTITIFVVGLVLFNVAAGGKEAAEGEGEAFSDSDGPRFRDKRLTAATQGPSNSTPRSSEEVTSAGSSKEANISTTLKTTAYTGPSTTTIKPLPPGWLLCTVGEHISQSTFVSPPDGLCTILMFDSLLTANGSSLTPPYAEGFQHFLGTASQHKKTEYGLGFDHEHSSSIAALVGIKDTKKQLDELWKKRVYHYGVINSPMRYGAGNPADFASDLIKSIKMISDLMNNKSTAARPSYTVLKFPLYDSAWAAAIGSRVRSNPVDIFLLAAYHEEEDTAKAGCLMVPPTLVDKPPGAGASDYPLIMSTALWSLAGEIDKWPATTAFAVALGMGGRWYEPKYPDTLEGKPGNYSLGQRCGRKEHQPSGQIAPVAEACKDAKYKATLYYDDTYDGAVAYDKTDKWLFTYDNVKALRTKLCTTGRYVTRPKLNFAAINVQFEDANNDCGSGAFARLHFLKALAKFFHGNYTPPAQLAACNRLA
ncbi:uncharacterized protein LOC144130188 [Amblyomma americanum]